MTFDGHREITGPDINGQPCNLRCVGGRVQINNNKVNTTEQDHSNGNGKFQLINIIKNENVRNGLAISGFSVFPFRFDGLWRALFVVGGAEDFPQIKNIQSIYMQISKRVPLHINKYMLYIVHVGFIF